MVAQIVRDMNVMNQRTLQQDNDNDNDNNAETCSKGGAFSNQSDWVVSENCNVSNVALTVLWTIVFVEYAVCGIYGAYKIYKIHRQLRQDSRASTTKNNGFLALLLYQCVSIPTGFILASIRLFSDSLIGIDLAPSVLFFVWRAAFYSSAQLIQPFLRKALLTKISKKARAELEKGRKLSATLLALTLANGIPVLAAPFTKDRDSKVITLVIYCAVASFTLAMYAFEALKLRNNVTAVLDESYKQSGQQNILQVKMKLSTFQNQIARTSFMQCLLFGLFAIPFFWDKFTYILPTALIQSCMLFIKFVRTMSRGEQASSSGGASGSEGMSSDNAPRAGRNNDKQPQRVRGPARGSNVGSSTATEGDGNSGSKTNTKKEKEAQSKKQSPPKQLTVAVVDQGDGTVGYDQADEDGNRVFHKSALPSPARIMQKLTPSSRSKQKREVPLDSGKSPHRREESFSDVKFFPNKEDGGVDEEVERERDYDYGGAGDGNGNDNDNDTDGEDGDGGADTGNGGRQ